VSFGVPWLEWAILPALIALTVVFALDFTRRRRLYERIGDAPMLLKMAASVSRRRRVFKATLFIIACVLVVAALAQPRVAGETVWRQRGIDVVVALDFSKSMLAKDVYPTRLERATLEAEELAAELEADRIATIVFAGAAVHFPLSHDHASARALYQGLSPADLPPGSDLGAALRLGRCLLRPDVQDGGCARTGGRGRGGDPLTGPAALATARTPTIADRARAIVVFTDGEDTEGKARAELDQAIKLGIEVYLIGVGTLAGELVPEVDAAGKPKGWKQGQDGAFVTTRLDQAALKELAAAAGGAQHYVVLDSRTRRLDGLVAALDHLKKGDLDERVLRKPKEIYQWLLFPAFLLLVIEACVSDRRRRVTT
jgi:Ca-activated chloride channel family protein